jgi:prolipoprotein diacylglyceryltransferase
MILPTFDVISARPQLQAEFGEAASVFTEDLCVNVPFVIEIRSVLWQFPSAAGSIFWLYLSMYAVLPFVLDFYRTTSARPGYSHFSEAQLLCVGVQAVSLAVLVRL